MARSSKLGVHCLQRSVDNFRHRNYTFIFQRPTNELQTNRGVLERLWIIYK